MSNILLVEDDVVTQSIVSGILSDHNMTVVVSGTARQAIDYFNENFFDLIISDLSLPDMDGVALYQEIKYNNATLKSTPFIILTSSTSNVDRKIAMKSGINCFLTKPVVPQELLSAIHSLLNKI